MNVKKSKTDTFQWLLRKVKIIIHKSFTTNSVIIEHFPKSSKILLAVIDNYNAIILNHS